MAKLGQLHYRSSSPASLSKSLKGMGLVVSLHSSGENELKIPLIALINLPNFILILYRILKKQLIMILLMYNSIYDDVIDFAEILIMKCFVFI